MVDADYQSRLQKLQDALLDGRIDRETYEKLKADLEASPFKSIVGSLLDRLPQLFMKVLDDAVRTITEPECVVLAKEPDILHEELARFPVVAGDAIRVAALNGFLSAPIIECVSVGPGRVRFLSGWKLRWGRFLIYVLVHIPLWILLAPAYFLLAVYVWLPAYGAMLLCRWFPVLRRHLHALYANEKWAVLVVCLLVMWFVGLIVPLLLFNFAIALAIALAPFALLLALFHRGAPDFVIVLADGFIFYSARADRAMRFPKATVFYGQEVKMSRGKLVLVCILCFLMCVIPVFVLLAVLARERKRFRCSSIVKYSQSEIGEFCELCVLNLPRDWAERQGIMRRPAPRGPTFWDEARRLKDEQPS